MNQIRWPPKEQSTGLGFTLLLLHVKTCLKFIFTHHRAVTGHCVEEKSGPEAKSKGIGGVGSCIQTRLGDKNLMKKRIQQTHEIWVQQKDDRQPDED